MAWKEFASEGEREKARRKNEKKIFSQVSINFSDFDIFLSSPLDNNFSFIFRFSMLN
jgi:hypothetical protein